MTIAPGVQDRRNASASLDRPLRRQDAFKKSPASLAAPLDRLERTQSAPVPVAPASPAPDLRRALDRSRELLGLARTFLQSFFNALVTAVVGLFDRVLVAALEGIEKL